MCKGNQSIPILYVIAWTLTKARLVSNQYLDDVSVCVLLYHPFFAPGIARGTSDAGMPEPQLGEKIKQATLSTMPTSEMIA